MLLDSTPSLQRQLLWGLGVCMSAFVVLNAVVVYRDTLETVHVAYDRTLLASAKTIGEYLELEGSGDQARIVARVPYAALEAFEADTRTRMTYRVSDQQGRLISGYPDMILKSTGAVRSQPYAALVEFFDAVYDAREVRVARLLQPVAGVGGSALAQIDVAETLELRFAAARRALQSALWHHLWMMALVLAVVWAVVHRATRGVRRIGQRIEARDPQDLSPVDVHDAPQELQPALEAANRMLSALRNVGEEQKRFVRDASHQLRTPLAVLKVQTQSALRGDVAPMEGLREINATVDRATHVANQMLALAKVEQMRWVAARDGAPVQRFDTVIREVALGLAPLIAQRHIEFDIATDPCEVRAHEWMLSELTRNLLANAIRFTPEQGQLVVTLIHDGKTARLSIADSGPGLSASQRENLFQPFSGQVSSATEHAGAGLGLLICRDVCEAIGAEMTLDNADPTGLIVSVRVPLAQPTSIAAGDTRYPVARPA